MIIPERFAELIIERLIPPVSIVIIIAKARTPSSGSWKAIDWRLLGLRNFPGRASENNSTRMTKIAPSERISECFDTLPLPVSVFNIDYRSFSLADFSLIGRYTHADDYDRSHKNLMPVRGNPKQSKAILYDDNQTKAKNSP